MTEENRGRKNDDVDNSQRAAELETGGIGRQYQ